MERINKKNSLNFNKELIFGEIGAITGAPLTAYIVSQLVHNTKIISFSAVIGAVLGQAVFWVSMRFYDKNRESNYSIKRLGEDLIFFTPVAFFLALFLYYPSIYFISGYLIKDQFKVIYAVISSQIIGFFLFLIAINLYRYILAKIYGKIL